MLHHRIILDIDAPREVTDNRCYPNLMFPQNMVMLTNLCGFSSKLVVLLPWMLMLLPHCTTKGFLLRMIHLNIGFRFVTIFSCISSFSLYFSISLKVDSGI